MMEQPLLLSLFLLLLQSLLLLLLLPLLLSLLLLPTPCPRPAGRPSAALMMMVVCSRYAQRRHIPAGERGRREKVMMRSRRQGEA